MQHRKSRFAFAVLLTLFAGRAAFSSDAKLVQFAGEVERGHEFRQPIGHGLVFALIPETGNPGAQSGWTITVSPEHPPESSDCRDLAWVVMPPYRSYNQRYLNNTYGMTAKDAVEMSPRSFNFVLNCQDYRVEGERVNILLWPYSHSQREQDDALAKLGSSPQGQGKLWIDKSRVGKAARDIEGVNYGSIAWIRFHVEIRFP